MDRKGNKIHSIQKKKFGSVEFLFSTLIKFVSILVCTIYIRTLVPSLKKKKTQKRKADDGPPKESSNKKKKK